MKKLVVVCGIASFGKSVTGALLETLGCSWFPLQDTLFQDYLQGRYTTENPDHLIQFYKMAFEKLSSVQPILSGISFTGDIQRRALLDPAMINAAIAELANSRFKSVQELWFAYRNAGMRAIRYKEVKSNPDIHVIIPGSAEAFEAQYAGLVDQVYFIYMRRDFKSWINSRIAAEQNYYRRYNPEKNRGKRPRSVFRYALLLRPTTFLEEYNTYEERLRKTRSMILDFDDLFQNDKSALVQKLAAYLELPPPPEGMDLSKRTFDLFGTVFPFAEAFTKFDDLRKYISPLSSALYCRMKERKKPSSIQKILAKVLFLTDYFVTNRWKPRLS